MTVGSPIGETRRLNTGVVTRAITDQPSWYLWRAGSPYGPYTWAAVTDMMDRGLCVSSDVLQHRDHPATSLAVGRLPGQRAEQPTQRSTIPRAAGLFAASLALGLGVVGAVWFLSGESHHRSAIIDASGGVVPLVNGQIRFEPGTFAEVVEVETSRLFDLDEVDALWSDPASDNELFMPISEIIDVTLDTDEMWGSTAEVTLTYDTDRVGASTDRVVGASWTGTHWRPWPSTVDPAGGTVTFHAEHFSPVGVVLWMPQAAEEVARPTGMRRVVSESGRFAVTYHEHGIHVVNPDYVAHRPDPSADHPGFVNDLIYFLDAAWEVFENQRYTMPPETSPVEVVVRDLNLPGLREFLGRSHGAIDGQTSWFGPVYIDSNLLDREGAPRPPDTLHQRLRAVALHEFYHYVQRYNPSFPTWFYEASAVWKEWQVLERDQPGSVNLQYINPRATFPNQGMWKQGRLTNDAGHEYARAGFLAYLGEVYGSNCESLMVDGFHQFGGRPIAMAVSGARRTNMLPTFVSVAKVCSGDSSVTWESLFTNFVLDWYIDRGNWPSGVAFRGNATSVFFVNHGPTTGHVDSDFVASLSDRGRPTPLQVFPRHRWPRDSGAVWRIANRQDVPRSSLVIGVSASGRWPYPTFWIYSVPGRPESVATLIAGPVRPTGNSEIIWTTAEIGDGAEPVSGHHVVGMSPGGSSQMRTQVRSHLLPQAASLTARKFSDRFAEVVWDPNEAWLPEGVGLTWHVYSGRDPDMTLGEPLVSRSDARARAAVVELPDGHTHVAVVAQDQWGNLSPRRVVRVEIESEPEDLVEPGDGPLVEQVMMVALERLGHEFVLADENLHDEHDLMAHLESGVGILSVIDEHGEQIGHFSNNPSRRSGDPSRETTTIVLTPPAILDGAGDFPQACPPDTAEECSTDPPHRGLPTVRVTTQVRQDTGGDVDRVTRSVALTVIADGWLFQVERRAACTGPRNLDTWACAPPDPTPPDGALDVLLDTAAELGMIDTTPG